MTLRGMGTSLTAACPSCLSLLDTSDERVSIIQRFEKKVERFTPKIPLGTRGKLDGFPWEVTGFQHRVFVAEGVEYGWDEYVLYNPYRGFRYLSEYRGHWNDIVPVNSLPVLSTVAGQVTADYDKKKFRLYQTSEPSTVFVLGEFPWRVQLHDRVTAKEYTCPPYLLASESDQNETTWSLGKYMTGREVSEAFALSAPMVPSFGVYSNQTNPYPSAAPLWWMMGLLSLVLLGVMILTSAMAGDETAFQSTYSFTPGAGEPSFVTPVFELKGGEKNVEIEIQTNLANDWMFLGFALISDETGTAYDFGNEMSFYSGRDSDGYWSEGSNSDSVTIGGVPGGKYYLRVEPDMEKSLTNTLSGGKRVEYSLKVRRDVAIIWPYFVAWPFLLLPPLYLTIRRTCFETTRWAEADPQGVSSTSFTGDDDDDE